MYRYLLNMSYIGTGLRGAQKQTKAGSLLEDPLSIQGQIEIALKKLRPSYMSSCAPSSRTDAGVHALQTSMHVDMQRHSNEPYDPRSITLTLNKLFWKNDVSIRILNTFIVPNTFHCRWNALWRTYLYRLAVLKTDTVEPHILLRHVPIEENKRMLFLCGNKFDIEKAIDASKLFVGLHDFRTFMARSSQKPDKITRRVLDRLDIIQVEHKPYSSYSWPANVHDKSTDYQFYDIYFQGHAFLYNQVRRTVGALIAVAQGKVTPRDIRFMLEVPSQNSWNPRIRTAPPHGLYLCEVAYSQSDYRTFKATL